MLVWSRHLLRLVLAAVPVAPHAMAAEAAAPHVWLRAPDASGHLFDLDHLRGQVVVLTFASRRSQRESTVVNERLSHLVEPGEVAVVGVVTLSEVPSFALGYAHRRVAEASMRSKVILLLDDRGTLWRSFAAHGADMLVIDRNGVLRDRFQGVKGVDQAIRAVEELRGSAAR